MEFLSVGFAVCLLSGLGCFYFFMKCVDWFEDI